MEQNSNLSLDPSVEQLLQKQEQKTRSLLGKNFCLQQEASQVYDKGYEEGYECGYNKAYQETENNFQYKLKTSQPQNEVLILKKENENMLKEIKKLENLIKEKEDKIVQLNNKIQKLENEISTNTKTNIKIKEELKEMPTKEYKTKYLGKLSKKLLANVLLKEKKIRIPFSIKDNKPKIVKLQIVKQPMKDTQYKKDNIKKLKDNYKKKTTNLNKNIKINYINISRKMKNKNINIKTNKKTNVIL